MSEHRSRLAARSAANGQDMSEHRGELANKERSE